ncbi:MAG: ROK family protein [Chitinophagaceae bacterium]|nr:MAG: ROK family protein [Chitinophagaceae bacterium]
MSVVLGVDIGGSHITAALVDLDKRAVVTGSGIRKIVNSQASAEAILQDWSEVITAVLQTGPDAEKKIGIAMPGPFDYEQGISLIEEQDKFTALYQRNVKTSLAERLAIPPDSIRFMNDASCFLQGEVFGGAATNFNPVLGLTLGTGLGSAFCVNGVAEDADLWKSPFREGIAEDYLSTRWFVGRYQQLTGKTISGVKELLECDAPLDTLQQLFTEFGENLGRFLVPQIRKTGAQAVVFGGNISKAFAFFQAGLNATLNANGINVALKTAVLNEEASLLGAASCWNTVPAKELV